MGRPVGALCDPADTGRDPPSSAGPSRKPAAVAGTAGLGLSLDRAQDTLNPSLDQRISEPKNPRMVSQLLFFEDLQGGETSRIARA